MATDKLKARFNALLPDFPEYWEDIRLAYGAKSRQYHNLDHLTAMLAGLDKYSGDIEDRQALELAVFYHDIIYNALRKNNERKSADLMKTLLLRTSLAPAVVQKIHGWILATKTHQITDKSDTDLALLLDLDLGILGATPERYRLYTQQIRKEYWMFPGPIFRRGRRKMVEHFLAKDRIYQTDYFFDKLEARARENLEKEM